MYLSWSAFYEGATDAHYFNVLIPRLLDDIVRTDCLKPCDIIEFPAVQFGVRSRSFDKVSEEICARKNEFHIIFVHADMGGRGLAENLADRREHLIKLANDLCGFNPDFAVMLSPDRELEAWALSDETALRSALGVNSIPQHLVPASPTAAEALVDPKATLDNIIRSVVRKRPPSKQILVRIAQEQSLSELRKANSFKIFERSLRQALKATNFIQEP